MSQAKPKAAIDLSALPPAIRQQVEAGLAKLPPDMRRQLIEQGSPVLERAIASARAKVATAAPAGSHSGPHRVAAREYHGHYNGTIRPGDRTSLRGWMVVLAGAVLLAAWLAD